MKLFALYIGGEHPRANIEVHDLRFVVAPSVRETYDQVRAQWWGTPDSLHVDCWAEIDHVDGYDVVLAPEAFAGKERLYYVNLGGYDQTDFLENHRNVFVVARTQSEAKTRVLRANKGWKQLHCDDVHEAERVFGLADAAPQQRLYIHLVPSTPARSITFTCAYTILKKRPPRRR
jgi:hypothetical protein